MQLLIVVQILADISRSGRETQVKKVGPFRVATKETVKPIIVPILKSPSLKPIHVLLLAAVERRIEWGYLSLRHSTAI